MIYSPRKHQQLAGDFLREHNRAALLLDMGLGKTVITLTRLAELFADFAIEKALVIAPKRVAEDTWTREAAKWDHLAGLRVVPVLGDRKHRLAALASPRRHLRHQPGERAVARRDLREKLGL